MTDIFQNRILLISIFSCFLAQFIKIFTGKEKRIDFKRIIISGGMPSSHSSFVTSLAMLVGFDKGFASTEFAITAVFAILLSFIGKFRAVIVTMPSPVMGGISLMLFSMIAIVGVKTIKREKVKMNIQNIIIITVIIFIGLSGNILSSPIGIAVTSSVSISGLSLAGIVGVILNQVMNLTYRTKI